MMKVKKVLLPFGFGIGVGILLTLYGFVEYRQKLWPVPPNYTPKKECWIQLYGESHGIPAFYQQELALWISHYKKGARILFIELPYYTGEWLNLWMHEKDDTILEQLYQDWEGSPAHNRSDVQFFKDIKKYCPETIFYGTDIGHQYDSTGARYLAYLKKKKKQHSEAYRLTKEAIAQGAYFYRHGSPMDWRTDHMVSNFIAAYERAGKGFIVGIYGSFHTNMDNSSEMASRLREFYGDHIRCISVGRCLNLWETLKFHLSP